MKKHLKCWWVRPTYMETIFTCMWDSETCSDVKKNVEMFYLNSTKLPSLSISLSSTRLWRATRLRQLETSTGVFVCVCQQRRRVSGSSEGIINQASSYWAHWTKAWEPERRWPFSSSKMSSDTLEVKPEPGCFTAWCPVFLDKSSERNSLLAQTSALRTVSHILHWWEKSYIFFKSRVKCRQSNVKLSRHHVTCENNTPSCPDNFHCSLWKLQYSSLPLTVPQTSIKKSLNFVSCWVWRILNLVMKKCWQWQILSYLLVNSANVAHRRRGAYTV